MDVFLNTWKFNSLRLHLKYFEMLSAMWGSMLCHEIKILNMTYL